jgi:hypothetical protein
MTKAAVDKTEEDDQKASATAMTMTKAEGDRRTSRQGRKKETNKQTKNQFLLIISNKKLIQNDYDPSPISDTIARISTSATN